MSLQNRKRNLLLNDCSLHRWMNSNNLSSLFLSLFKFFFYPSKPHALDSPSFTQLCKKGSKSSLIKGSFMSLDGEVGPLLSLMGHDYKEGFISKWSFIKRELWNQGNLFPIGGWCLQKWLNEALQCRENQCVNKRKITGADHRHTANMFPKNTKYCFNSTHVNMFVNRLIYTAVHRYMITAITHWWSFFLYIITTKSFTRLPKIHTHTRIPLHTPTAPQATIIN